jgi:transcription initiation factor TFIIIB Brf1 subunit/transcription initiation factor TFIIB
MTEEDIRSQSCYFIREVGIKLNLPQLTIATAIVFFHKYAKRNSIIQENPFMISTSCIFLAGKVEETPKKLQDVISVSYHIRFKRQLKIDSQEYLEIRESVLKRECRILQTIGFRFTVEHPYKYILKYTGDIKGSREIAQTAWNFVNDSLRTTMCLTHSPQIIAAATVYLAARYHESDIPTTSDSNNRKCFLQFKVEELEGAILPTKTYHQKITHLVKC